MLSGDLLSEIARAVVPDEPAKRPVEAMGTARVGSGRVTVELDGSENATPVAVRSVAVRDGDRVRVSITGHGVSLVANLTDPSASTSGLEEASGKIAEVAELVAGKVSADELEAQVARIDQLTANDVEIRGELTATNAYVEELKAEVAEFGDLTAVNAKIEDLEATKADITVLESEYATIKDLEATSADVHDLEADYADFKVANADRLTAQDAKIDDLEATKLDAEQAHLSFANIDFSNIGMAAVEELFGKSGIIGDLVVDEGRITGHLVGVTISGDLIEGNTIKADKLVVLGSDGLYYKLNVDAETVAAEQTEYNSLNGSIITAKSITAEKVAVSDLVAFDATIGGFHITADSLYSGAKASAGNTTRGVYLDSTGQLSVGDQSNYLKYFKDADGTWKLVISAGSIKLGSSSGTLEEELDGIRQSVEQAVDGGKLTYARDGEVVLIEGNAGKPPVGVTFYGETRQNLWANPPSATKNGITYVANANGSMKVSGTSTGETTVSSVVTYVLRPGATYTVSASTAISSGMQLYFAMRSYNGTSSSALTAFGSTSQGLTKTFTVPSDSQYCTCILYSGGAGAANSVTVRVMLNEGSEVQDWCPPGLNCVKDLQYVTAGKNLLASENRTYSDIFWSTAINDFPRILNELAGLPLVLKYEATLTTADDLSKIANTLFGAIARHGTATSVIKDYIKLMKWDTGAKIGTTRTVVYNFMIDSGKPVDNFWIYGCGNSKDSPNYTDGKADIRILLRVATDEDNWVEGSELVDGPIPADEWDDTDVVATPLDLQGNELRSLPDGTRDELHIDSNGRMMLTKRVTELSDFTSSMVSTTAVQVEGANMCYSLYRDTEGNRLRVATATTRLNNSLVMSEQLRVVDGYTSRTLIDHSCFYSDDSSANPHYGCIYTKVNGDEETEEDFISRANALGLRFLAPLDEPQVIDLGTVALPALPKDYATLYAVTDTDGMPVTGAHPGLSVEYWTETGAPVADVGEDAQEAANAAQDRADSAYEKAADLEVTVDGIEGRVSDAEGNISKVTQTATSLGTRLATAEKNISTVTQTATSLGTRLTTAEKNISTVTQTASGLSTRVSTAEKDITSLEQTASSLTTRVSSAEGKITTVTTTASGLDVRLTQAEKDVDAAQSTANTAKTNAATAQSTANAAKTAASTAQSTANNAAKTATNYLGFSSSGLVVGTNSSGSGQSGLQGNVRLYNGGMEVRNGTTVLASYGASTIELGKNSTSSKISMCGGTSEVSYGTGNGNNNKTTTITSKNKSTSPSSATIALKAMTSSGDGYTTYEFSSNGTIVVNDDGTRRELVKHLVYTSDLFPVGTVLIMYGTTSPASIYGGTWARITSAFLWAAQSSGQSPGEKGGSNSTTISAAQMPAHTHTINIGTSYPEASNYGLVSGGGFTNRAIVNETADKTETQSKGSGSSFSRVPAYIALYVWRRTA